MDLSIRGGADLASISGDAFAQLTNLEEKAPERAGSRPPRARTLSGEVRLALDLRATAFDLDAVDGTIVATTLAISAGQFPIAQQSPTRLRLEKGRIHIEQFDWKLPSGALAASGTIGLGPPNHSDMRVSGTMSLGLVDVFLPGRGAGRAAFDIRIAGPIDSPQYQGAIELTDARLILPEGRVSLAGWTGRLEVTGETVAAAALRGQVNGGDVSLNGTVTRRGTAQASPLTISARNVFLEIPRGLRSELNADLTWRNESGRAALSGTATITADPYTEPATAMVRIVSALTRASSDTRPSAAAVAGRHDARRHAPIQRSADAREQRRKRRYGSGSAPDRHDVGRRTGRLDRHRGRRPHSSQWEVVSTEGERHRVYAGAGAGAATERLW